MEEYLFSICKAWDVAGSAVISIFKNKYKINERQQFL
jgi:hypothetical protein